jgi:hypothetical protein
VAYICMNTVFCIKCICPSGETSQTCNLMMYISVSIFRFSNVASVLCCVGMLEVQKIVLNMQTCYSSLPRYGTASNEKVNVQYILTHSLLDIYKQIIIKQSKL